MIKKITCTLVAALCFVSAAALADLPGYYPKTGFQRVGTLDDVQPDRRMVVINDIPFSVSDNVIVHSLSSFSVPFSRLRLGTKVGYKMASGGRTIVEIWLLPNSYESPQRR